jgi:hypothetical protein
VPFPTLLIWFFFPQPVKPCPFTVGQGPDAMPGLGNQNCLGSGLMH